MESTTLKLIKGKMEEITNETDLQLYEVKNSENGEKLQIVAIDFNDLQKDLISNKIEPEEIRNIGETYVTNGVLNK